jgi:hypothetical protein
MKRKALHQLLVDFLIHLHNAHGWNLDEEGTQFVEDAEEPDPLQLMAELRGLARGFLKSKL